MAENDLLHWSDELEIWFLDEDVQTTVPEDYLFRMGTFDECFWTIALEMAQLND